MSAREDILSRIRRATSDVPPEERPQDVAVERGYRDAGYEPREVIVARFAEAVAEYKATVHHVGPNELAHAISEALARRGVRRLVVPEGVPAEWVPEGVEALRDRAGDPLPVGRLDDSDGVLTGCALGIAQTGTIALDAGASQGRRALTLLPDYHLCVVREEQVYGLVPEAIAALEEAVVGAERAITFISGPSATSDIELNRVEGVHGPRTLELLIAG